MFRRLPASLPKDAEYPANLEELGYFITDTGHVKQIENPAQDFEFAYTTNERHNDVHREALHKCLRSEFIRRIIGLGVQRLYLPNLSTKKPEEPAVPVLITPAEDLRQCKRVLVVVNDSVQDLGFWAYRQLTGEGGLHGGSAISLVEELTWRSHNHIKPTSPNGYSDELDGCTGNKTQPIFEAGAFGIIILNSGQLRYSHRYKRAMTATTWSALPRPSLYHDEVVFDSDENTVTGNRDTGEHTKFVFHTIINNPDFVSSDAKVYAIGIEAGAHALLHFLNQEWDSYKSKVAAIALTKPFHNPDDMTNSEFVQFLADRGRAWDLSTHDIDVPIRMPESKLKESAKDTTKTGGSNENTDSTASNIDISDIKERRAASFKSDSSKSLAKTNPDMKVYLEKLQEKGVGECALETFGVDKDLFLTTDEATEKTMEAKHRRDSVSRRRNSVMDHVHPDGDRIQSATLDVALHLQTDSTIEGIVSEAKEAMNPPMKQEEIEWGEDMFKGEAPAPVSCPTFSSGEEFYGECIFPKIYKSILNFFDEVAKNPDDYVNPKFKVVNPVQDDIPQELLKPFDPAKQAEMDAMVPIMDVSHLFAGKASDDSPAQVDNLNKPHQGVLENASPAINRKDSAILDSENAAVGEVEATKPEATLPDNTIPAQPVHASPAPTVSTASDTVVIAGNEPTLAARLIDRIKGASTAQRLEILDEIQRNVRMRSEMGAHSVALVEAGHGGWRTQLVKLDDNEIPDYSFGG